MKKRLNAKGFTLVELLVVVVILGILASIIVPRMLAQTGQAAGAEAINMLGVIRRSAVNWTDGGSGAIPAFDTAGTAPLGGMAAGSDWAALGMAPLPTTRRFDYSTAGGALAVGLLANAFLRSSGDTTADISMDLETSAITCADDLPNDIVNNTITVGCR